MPITIVSHFYSDIDSVFGTWLLFRFGGIKYQGIEDSEIILIPAGEVPEQIAETISESGRCLIAVDTGHRDFDTHGLQTLEKSASLMIAKNLGIEDDPRLLPLIRFVEQNEQTGESLAISDYLAQSLLWPSLIKGVHQYKDWTQPHVFQDMFPLLDAAASFEDFSPEDVKAFWLVEDDEDYNSRLTALVQNWFKGEVQSTGSPFSKYRFSELLGLGYDDENPLCPLFAGLLTNSRLSEFFSDLDKYPLAYLKNSLIGVLISYALRRDLTDETMQNRLAPVIKGLLLTEIEWSSVLKDLVEGSCYTTYPFKTRKKKKYNLVYVEHDSQLVTKAIRHTIRKVGVILCCNPTINSMSVILNHPSPVQSLKLSRLAALFRRGEALAANLKWTVNNKQSHQPGNIMDWYLHDSEKLLMHGSFKSPAHLKSEMDRNQITNLTAVFLSDDIPVLPSLGCPGDSCRKANCIFYDLKLPICEQIRSISTNPFVRALFPQKVKEAIELGVYSK